MKSSNKIESHKSTEDKQSSLPTQSGKQQSAKLSTYDLYSAIAKWQEERSKIASAATNMQKHIKEQTQSLKVLSSQIATNSQKMKSDTSLMAAVQIRCIALCANISWPHCLENRAALFLSLRYIITRFRLYE